MSGGSLSLFRDREFLALAGTAFARAQAYSTIAIALALYADIFATSGTVEGLFGTAFAAIQLLIVLPLGRAIDTGNAKRYLLAGLVLNVAVFIGFAFVDSVAHVVLMRVFQGLGASLLWITGSTVVGEISPEESRGQWLGTYNQVGAFSSLAGDLVGGVLLATSGFVLTYSVLAGVTVLACVGVLLFLRDNPGGQADLEDSTGVETLRLLLGRTAIRALVVFRLVFSFGKMAVILFLPIYARTAFGMSPILVGGILAGGKLTKSLTQGFVGSYTDRVGREQYFVFVGALLYGVGAATIPFAEHAAGLFAPVTVRAAGLATTLPPAFFPLFGAFAVCGLADSIRLPASMSLFVAEGEHFDAVAGSLSLRSLAWKVGQVAGPVSVGALWDATDVFTAFFTVGAFIAVAAVAFLSLYRLEPAPEGVPTPGD
ncbi:MFS transporter [Halobacteriales archaeon QH_7_68_42]|nr:MAG: MFS transporter [Halobacteriales archaeon QH_7_68_42]